MADPTPPPPTPVPSLGPVPLVRSAYLRYRIRVRRKRGRSVRLRVGDVPAFFASLDRASIPYVVMRWFDETPLTPAQHSDFVGDVDVLIGDDDPWGVARAAARVPGRAAVELRSVYGRIGSYAGTPYYPPSMAEEMLASRVRDRRGFFIPGPGVRLACVLFHLCYHKAETAGLPTGCDIEPSKAKRDYGAKLRAFADEYGEELPRTLTLTSIHDELVRRDWHLRYDLLTRWPLQSAWIRHLTTRTRAELRSGADACPRLVVLLLREDLPAPERPLALDEIGQHFDLLEHGPLSVQQSDRLRRSSRGGNWHSRPGAAPAGPVHYALCSLPPDAPRGRAPRLAWIKRRKEQMRDRLRAAAKAAGRHCGHALHSSDDALEASAMLEALYGADATGKRNELAGRTTWSTRAARPSSV